MEKTVLCRLKGIMAVAGAKTRNGTIYGKELWENVFSSDSYQELIKTKSFFIGLDHPDEATQTSLISTLRNAAGIVSDLTYNKVTGDIEVVIDILNTEMGRIANTIAQYGCSLGLSTRAMGDILPGSGGVVDPDTFEFLGADLVCVPSQEKGRLRLVLEEGYTKNKSKAYDLDGAIKHIKNKSGYGKELLEALERDAYSFDTNDALDLLNLGNGGKEMRAIRARRGFREAVENGEVAEDEIDDLVDGSTEDLDTMDVEEEELLEVIDAMQNPEDGEDFIEGVTVGADENIILECKNGVRLEFAKGKARVFKANKLQEVARLETGDNLLECAKELFSTHGKRRKMRENKMIAKINNRIARG